MCHSRCSRAGVGAAARSGRSGRLSVCREGSGQRGDGAEPRVGRRCRRGGRRDSPSSAEARVGSGELTSVGVSRALASPGASGTGPEAHLGLSVQRGDATPRIGPPPRRRVARGQRAEPVGRRSAERKQHLIDAKTWLRRRERAWTGGGVRGGEGGSGEGDS